MNKIKLIMSLVLLLVLSVGCLSKQEVSIDQQSLLHEGTTSSVCEIETSNAIGNTEQKSEENIVDEEHPLYDIKPGVIEDDEILNYLYNEYFYKAITTIYNHGDFSQASDIQPRYIVEFAARTYMSQNGINHLEADHEGDYYRYIPIDALKPYLKLYFNINSFDVSSFSGLDFNKERQAVYVNTLGVDELNDYKAPNSWGIHLENVRMTDEGEIIGELNQYFDESDQLKKCYKLTLAPHMNHTGTFYIRSGVETFYSQNIVEIDGNYEVINTFAKYQRKDNALNANIYFLCEIEDAIILSMSVHGLEGGNKLVVVDKESKMIIKELDIENSENEEIYRIEAKEINPYGKVIALFTNHDIRLLDMSLNELGSIMLPQKLKEEIVEYEYDSNDALTRVFFGYDISSDMQLYVYSNERGLHLLDTTNESSILIQEKLKRESKFSKYHHFSQPQFVGKSNNVYATITGYEWSNGFLLYMYDTKSVQLYEYVSDYDPILKINGTKSHLAVSRQEPIALNLLTGEQFDIPEAYLNVNFAVFFEGNYLGYHNGEEGVITVKWNEEFNKAEIGYIDQHGIVSEEKLVIKNAHVDIIGHYKDNMGNVNAIISYLAEGNENGIILFKIH